VLDGAVLSLNRVWGAVTGVDFDGNTVYHECKMRAFEGLPTGHDDLYFCLPLQSQVRLVLTLAAVVSMVLIVAGAVIRRLAHRRGTTAGPH